MGKSALQRRATVQSSKFLKFFSFPPLCAWECPKYMNIRKQIGHCTKKGRDTMKRRIKGIAASAVALAMAGTMIVPASTVFAAQNGTTIMQPQNQQFGGGGQNNFGGNGEF